ncbi:DUF1648 domain-containing protein [Acetivibrio cellulolyticus]|uniref:DUF1648 domain-containing protein n=1 Tax=Acetivibrio cellulolyticus TaxID=35830 RepID=UPI0001E30158|nr:DUF1648 domain-containing protein [Acetivibrio cellulolyticus]
MENKRPKIKISLTMLDIYLEVMAVIGVIIYVAILIYGWVKLPDIIPKHFNVSGQIDSYGSKSTLFILLPVIIFLYTLLTVMSRFPHIYSYPVEITQDNAEIQYTKAARLMRILKLVIVVIFTYIQYAIMNSALHQKSELGILFLPITLILVFVPLGYFIYQSVKNK